MSKSIYSLVLNDDVVAMIDKLAYSMNTNRSNTVNQILADYVSYTTPEKRIKDIFGKIENMLTGDAGFQTLLQPSDSMFSLRSVLSYKYNPTVRYSVEMYRSGMDATGELRVSLRTQNSSLILYTSQFFRLWAKLEEKYIGECEYKLEDGRFIRRLHLPGGLTDEQIGEAIAYYIEYTDKGMKAFFDNLENPAYAVTEVEELYNEYLRGGGRIL